eukprot:7131047-Pyramimonas_sp.AAC.1
MRSAPPAPWAGAARAREHAARRAAHSLRSLPRPTTTLHPLRPLLDWPPPPPELSSHCWPPRPLSQHGSAG